MSLHAAVRFANEAFYLAFRGRDLAAMDDVWSQEQAVTCIHPGWPALLGRDQVMRSWAEIFAHGQEANIHCRGVRVFSSDGRALVICYETLDENLLVATNIFAPESGNWRLVHHQAGPCNALPPDLPEEESASLQ